MFEELIKDYFQCLMNTFDEEGETLEECIQGWIEAGKLKEKERDGLYKELYQI